MTKKEFVEIIDIMEGAGYEVQQLERGQFTGDVSRAPSYFMRFQRKDELEKEAAKKNENGCVLGTPEARIHGL